MRDKILLIHRINIVIKSNSRKIFPVRMMFLIQSIFLLRGNLKFTLDSILYYMYYDSIL